MGVENANGREELSKTSRGHAKSVSSSQERPAEFPPPKTDKPRPHVCTTCMRGFARLEHLKRHERSHTKEKPFACEQCARCFARRDLLLRHQQKLHMTVPPSVRARGARRESMTSVSTSGGGRVRKNSTAGASASNAASMRPRANTISHVENSAAGMLTNGHNFGPSPDVAGMGLDINPPAGLPGVSGYHFRGMSTAPGQHGNVHGLPKLETRNRNIDIGVSLRTAPPIAHGSGTDYHKFWCQPGSTVNPAQLHFANSPHSYTFDSPSSPLHTSLPGFGSNNPNVEGDMSFPWLSSFENQLTFQEDAIENSTPSDSENSPDGVSEMMLDTSVGGGAGTDNWPASSIMQSPQNMMYPMDVSGHHFAEYGMEHLSPKSMTAPFAPEQFFPAPPILPSQPLANPIFSNFQANSFQPGSSTKSATPSNSAGSIGSSNRQSSVTSFSTDSITDITRTALLTTLSSNSLYGIKTKGSSQSQAPSATLPSTNTPGQSADATDPLLPSTSDLQRYVGAYIQYFHPHLPFLHTASLSFDSPVFTSVLQASTIHAEYGQPGIIGGGGALILAMAAIGALYEYDFGPSRNLFDMSRAMIRLYTGERRKFEMSNSSQRKLASEKQDETTTPLWLVQAMLLNVIYGHNCGDKVAAGIASNLCGSVVNLARSANLTYPHSPQVNDPTVSENSAHAWSDFQNAGSYELQREWSQWKAGEERKRTLYAVFILSSLLTSAYNHAPALTNSEMRLELPCDESLWAAESAQIWKSLDGSVHRQETPFATALTTLLTAHQRRQPNPQLPEQHWNFGLFDPSDPATLDFKTSTFGCLVLINALHNYIWETRQRHPSLEWTNEETEAMRMHIEPALRTWQSVWSLSPEHSMERPNPFGASSLSADCIPLLDLAYLRLFVNLGKSKEAFFLRDWDAMAKELANGQEIIQHADHSFDDAAIGTITCSKRESHLRKAAFFAVNSLALTDRLGVTFADFNSRELPLQSALCAFDCAQILAEWVSTLQQRVGPHLGMLGSDDGAVRSDLAMTLLDDEDRELLNKTAWIVKSTNLKLSSGSAMDKPEGQGDCARACGDLGSDVLLAHARMFERASIWPLTNEIAQSLRTQASHIHDAALSSVHTSA